MFRRNILIQIKHLARRLQTGCFREWVEAAADLDQPLSVLIFRMVMSTAELSAEFSCRKTTSAVEGVILLAALQMALKCVDLAHLAA